MHNFLNDPVDVVVTFSEQRVRPVRMRWDNREYNINNVHLIHTAKEGEKRIFYFSVSDQINAFKLKLDTNSLEWRLVEVYSD